MAARVEKDWQPINGLGGFVDIYICSILLKENEPMLAMQILLMYSICFLYAAFPWQAAAR